MGDLRKRRSPTNHIERYRGRLAAVASSSVTILYVHMYSSVTMGTHDTKAIEFEAPTLPRIWL